MCVMRWQILRYTICFVCLPISRFSMVDVKVILAVRPSSPPPQNLRQRQVHPTCKIWGSQYAGTLTYALPRPRKPARAPYSIGLNYWRRSSPLCQSISSINDDIRPRHVTARITGQEHINLHYVSNVGKILREMFESLTPLSSDASAIRLPGIISIHLSKRSFG